MSTAIESMTGIIVRSPFFSNPTTLEFFPVHPEVIKKTSSPKRNRVALLYGSNGSGKSTIAQGFREYAGSVTPRSVELFPVSGTAQVKISSDGKPPKFFVFDETYITQNVKVHEEGLGSIVLFGQQVQLDQRLNELDQAIGDILGDIDRQEQVCMQYDIATNVVSPIYWLNLITKKLQKSGGWADTSGIRIKRNQIKTRVTDVVISTLGRLTPGKDEATTRKEFERLISIFDNTSTLSTPITPAVPTVTIPYNILSIVQKQLIKKPHSAPLSQRETELLDMMGMSVLSSAKGFLSVSTNTICPQCLQPISKLHREEMLNAIEKILNREIDEFCNELQELLIPEVEISLYKGYEVVDATLMAKIQLQVNRANRAIQLHNEHVRSKTKDPLSEVLYEDSIAVGDNLLVLNKLLAELENKRLAINRVIADRRTTEKKLLLLNDTLGHYDIIDDYARMLTQENLKKADFEKQQALRAQYNTLVEERKNIDAQRRNFQLAVEQINKSLSYIFCSKQRLEVKLENDQLYHLKSKGQPVTPNKISCGERNALALCYFFTEIARETEFCSMYSQEMFLVIDDPISSFDLENRVGILSFLRFKFNQILSACATTKLLVMTHDISVLFDLQKAMDEISKACSACRKNAEYTSYQLKNKTLQLFLTQKHSEYTKLMQCVYEYGCSPTDDQDLVIGNVMRRMLEAFSTFTFKEGIEKISLNASVLSLIHDEHRREYFQNSMYRLVLNTESHSQEAMQGAPEASFYSHISREEKQRTARDILCFMYCISPIHVLAHLPDAKNEIEAWMENI